MIGPFMTLENFTSSVCYEVKIFASAEAFLDSDAPLQTGLRGFGLVAAGHHHRLELQRKLAADGLGTPAIKITTNGIEKNQAEAVEASAIAFLRKPFKEKFCSPL